MRARPEEAGRRLAQAPAVAAVRGALAGGPPAWVVGGAVRDAVLGRPVGDIDLAVDGDPREVAAAIARACGGSSFELSAEFGTWRAVRGSGGWQVDVARLRGGSLESDLAARDFTIGAVAVPLGGGPPVDPLGGIPDIEAGVLRVAGPGSFAEDPLRLLRAARLVSQLGLAVEPSTAELARSESGRAGEPAGERQLAELRLLVGGPDPVRGLALMDELGVTAPVLPELEALKGVEQNRNHHLDVHRHTIAVLERLLEVEADLERFAGPGAPAAAALLGEPLADGFTRGEALRFGAVVHDLGKPATRGEWEGGVTFIGHDRAGAEIVGKMMGRLRASRRLTRHLEALTLHHLRLGFLVHERPLGPRAVHRYLRATEPVTVDVTLLTAADRLAARGSGPIASEEAVEAHLGLVREMLAPALEWRRQGPPEPLLRGDELAGELGLAPGPELGRLLGELEEAQYAGEVADRDAAVAFARELLATDRASGAR
ncbi:MAG: HDIG domain-containing protein [Solirubrobacterales bacterium]